MNSSQNKLIGNHIYDHYVWEFVRAHYTPHLLHSTQRKNVEILVNGGDDDFLTKLLNHLPLGWIYCVFVSVQCTQT